MYPYCRSEFVCFINLWKFWFYSDTVTVVSFHNFFFFSPVIVSCSFEHYNIPPLCTFLHCFVLNILNLVLCGNVNRLGIGIFKRELNCIDLKIRFYQSLFQPPISHFLKRINKWSTHFSISVSFLCYLILSKEVIIRNHW